VLGLDNLKRVIVTPAVYPRLIAARVIGLDKQARVNGGSSYDSRKGSLRLGNNLGRVLGQIIKSAEGVLLFCVFWFFFFFFIIISF
jgi:hypothetical protein